MAFASAKNESELFKNESEIFKRRPKYWPGIAAEGGRRRIQQNRSERAVTSV